MIGIYKIINLNNNKVYIGRSNNIERRWKDHLRYSNNPSSREYHSPLHRAIRKYGIDSFKLEILEETLLEDLNSKEQYWIEHFQSHLSDKGYNLTLGGQGKLGKGKLINQYDLNGAFIKTWEGPTVAGIALKININTIRQCCYNPEKAKTAGGYQWKFTEDSRVILPYQRQFNLTGLELGEKFKPKTCYQYDQNNNLLQTFLSRSDAIIWLHNNGYPTASLSYLGKRIKLNKPVYGFYWKGE